MARRIAWIVDQLHEEPSKTPRNAKAAFSRLERALSRLRSPYDFEVVFLTGQRATRACITGALRQLKSKQLNLDVLLVHWVSHGGLENGALKVQTAGTDAPWAFEELSSLIMDVQADTHVISLDCCEAAMADAANDGLNLIWSGAGTVPPTHEFTQSVAQELETRPRPGDARRWSHVAEGVRQRNNDANQSAGHRIPIDSIVVTRPRSLPATALAVAATIALLPALDAAFPCDRVFQTRASECVVVHSINNMTIFRQASDPSQNPPFIDHRFKILRLASVLTQTVECGGQTRGPLPKAGTFLCGAP